MKTEEKKAYYLYAIEKIKSCKDDSAYDEIVISGKDIGIFYPAKDRAKLMNAIISEEEREDRGITQSELEKKLNKHGLNTLNYVLKGRCFVLISDFKSTMEYTNAVTNGRQFTITNIDLDGKIAEDDAYSFDEREVMTNIRLGKFLQK